MSDDTKLGRELAELERTNPAVKAAAENYDRVRDSIVHVRCRHELAIYREALGRYMSGEDSRAQVLRLKMFQMRDAREVASAAGFTLTTEAKARLYDIQQDIIRAAIAADDRALAAPPHPLESPTKP